MGQIRPDRVDIDRKQQSVELNIYPRSHSRSGAVMMVASRNMVIVVRAGVRMTREELAKLLEVRTITLGRMRGKPLFKLQIIQKLLDNCIIFHNHTYLFKASL